MVYIFIILTRIVLRKYVKYTGRHIYEMRKTEVAQKNREKKRETRMLHAIHAYIH
jgi:hypothetical protein